MINKPNKHQLWRCGRYAVSCKDLQDLQASSGIQSNLIHLKRLHGYPLVILEARQNEESAHITGNFNLVCMRSNHCRSPNFFSSLAAQLQQSSPLDFDKRQMPVTNSHTGDCTEGNSKARNIALSNLVSSLWNMSFYQAWRMTCAGHSHWDQQESRLGSKTQEFQWGASTELRTSRTYFQNNNK